ncbi:MAG: hypothetical protein SH850_04635 [Planctomycetaceae bacterium]|nr:hypothetical protein [Planctomycetaceae bacterium]
MTTPSSLPLALTGDHLVDAAIHGYYWQLGSNRTLNWALANGFGGEFWNSPSGTAAGISAIFSSISYYANVGFNYVGYYTTPSVAYANGSDLTVSVDGAFISSVYGNATWAIGLFPSAANNTAYYQGAPGDVFLNIRSQANFLPSYAPGSAGYALLIHEIGHALGLKHPFDSGGNDHPTLASLGLSQLDKDWFSVMAYADDYNYNLRFWDPATPMALDVLALQYLYGPNLQTNAGNSSFTLTLNSQYQTIWDAGGTDVVNAAASSVGWQISLPAFQLSALVATRLGAAMPLAESLLPSPRTLYWLMGDIENVTGSAFADQIDGNGLSNILAGGNGNDTLTGLDRNDTLTGGAGDDGLRGGSTSVSFNSNGARARLVDLDGDGRVDIAQTEAGGRIRAWLANGTGFDSQSIWGAGSRVQDQMADFNADRKTDVVQLHENGNIYVWTSNGAGFNAYDVWGRGARPTDKLADFSGDGRADVIQLHENGNLYVWTSNGTRFDDYAVWGRGSRPQDKLADFNGDGRADVIQLHENGNLYVWTSKGAGFNDYSVWGRGSRPTDKPADFNGDGKADIAQLHENGNIYVWTSNGAGFNDYAVWGRGARPSDLLADVNGDGRADVVQLHENGNIYVWTSNGTGFNNYTVWGHGARPTDQLADVNGDGRADVVELHENGNAYVWLSTGNSFADYRVLGTGAPDGGGDDTFVFGPGFGRDVVRDFEGGAGAGDVLRFDPAVFGSFASVMSNAADDSQGNTRITYDGSNSVLLEHVRRSQLVADDFTFGVA